MQLSEDETIEKDGNFCKHCGRNTLPPYEYEWSGFGCGYNVTNESTNFQNFKEK